MMRLGYNQPRIKKVSVYQETDKQILFLLYIDYSIHGVGVSKEISSGITGLLVESHGSA
jgi:hypothetical protein